MKKQESQDSLKIGIPAQRFAEIYMFEEPPTLESFFYPYHLWLKRKIPFVALAPSR